MIQLTCPYCRHEWSVGDPLGGSSVWCPQCGTPNDVPVPEPPSVSDSATVEGSAKGSRETIDFSEFLAPPVDSGELGRLGGYSVLRPIGIGGMGIVFEAEDVILKRRIALKVMRPDVARSDIARKRFLREAEAAAKLKHDHILSIYQIGEERSVLYLTMPLLHGETLDSRLKREQRLPIPEVVAMGKQVAEGLAAAHAKGLIHRDIKPGNIWLETVNQRLDHFGFRPGPAGEPRCGCHRQRRDRRFAGVHVSRTGFRTAGRPRCRSLQFGVRSLS